MNMVDACLDRHIRDGRGDRIALRTPDQALTYAELHRLVGGAAALLVSAGLKPGDRLVLRVGIGISGLAVFLASIRLGLCPIPTSILLGEVDFSRIVRHSAPRMLVVQDSLVGAALPVLGEVPLYLRIDADFPERLANSDAVYVMHEATPDTVAYMLYTSGSTGHPKGVMRSHRVLSGSARANVDALMQLTPDDVCYQPHQDFSFSYPLGHGVLFPLYAGASVVIHPARPSGRLDPEAVFAAIDRFGVTVFSGVPGIYRLLADVPDAGRRFSCSTVRLWITAGEPLPPTILAQWEEDWGHPVYETMGQSEVPSFVGHYPGLAIRPGALGKPFPGIPVEVLNDAYEPCPPEEVGQLAIRADYAGLCSGYFLMQEKWQTVCHDGWYFTQDLAERDRDGYLWHRGRADEIIKVRGYSVSPSEVEEALESLPWVQRAGVIGVRQDDVTKIWAFIEAAPGVVDEEATIETVRQALRAKLSRYKQPDRYRFVAHLPTTDSGKLKRRALAEWTS